MLRPNKNNNLDLMIIYGCVYLYAGLFYPVSKIINRFYAVPYIVYNLL